MTAQPPDPMRGAQPQVPATFLPDGAEGAAGRLSDWSLGELTGPWSMPPGGITAPGPQAPARRRRKAARLPNPATWPAPTATGPVTAGPVTNGPVSGPMTAGPMSVPVTHPSPEPGTAPGGESRPSGSPKAPDEGRADHADRYGDAAPVSDTGPGAPAPRRPEEAPYAEGAPPEAESPASGGAEPEIAGRKTLGRKDAPEPQDAPEPEGPEQQDAAAYQDPEPEDAAQQDPEPEDLAPSAGPVAPLPSEDRKALLDGVHRDPHAQLGARVMPEGTVRFRALRPYAEAVTVVVPYADGEQRARLRDEGDGFFAGEVMLDSGLLAAGAEVPEYRLLTRYAGGEEVRDGEAAGEIDPYALPPALGELDLRLFGEGRHEVLWRALGARTMTHRGVTGTRFTVWAPNAQGVRVVGDFNDWDGTAAPMRALGESGVWELFLPRIGDGARYKFEVVREDGSRVLHADPMARATEVPPAGASLVHTSTYRWGDGDWLDRRAAGSPLTAPMSVYEVHLPSWRPGLTYRELAAQLTEYVRESGFTHVELMPCAEHPFGGSWGYQVTGFYAPTARLGGPDDFKYLVDSLHRAGIGVLMDFVPAHFPKDEWALARFDGGALYEHPDPQRAEHPDWGTLEFDFGRPEVRNFLVSSAVYWCEEFHIDGLRVDAVASMLYLDYSREPGEWTPNSEGGRENPDAVALLQELNATLHRRCPGVVTAAEESTTWDGVTRATDHPGESGFGGLGFDFKWNLGWMHDSLGYLGLEPAERAHQGERLARAMTYAYAENFILPVSHDEVVHGKRPLVGKMPGDERERLAGHRAFLAFMWAHPGKQLLFMGQEFAQDTEWSEERGPDWALLGPNAPGGAAHRGVQDLVRDLNVRYAATPALWQLDTHPAGFRWVEDGSSGAAAACRASVFAFLRFDASGDPLLSVSNFSAEPVSSYRLGVPAGAAGGGVWRKVLDTDDVRYGGSGAGGPEPAAASARPSHGFPASVVPELPALSTLWFRPA